MSEQTAVVHAWQAGALSRESMMDIFRRGEVLPEGRSNEEEMRLNERGKVKPPQGLAGGKISGKQAG